MNAMSGIDRELFRPFRAAEVFAVDPRALPWARLLQALQAVLARVDLQPGMHIVAACKCPNASQTIEPHAIHRQSVARTAHAASA